MLLKMVILYINQKEELHNKNMSANINSKRVIVLGATGSLGTHIAVHMKQCGYDVIAVGHSRPDNGFYAERGIEYMTMDIADKSAFDRLPQENVWAVLNFAGALPVLESIKAVLPFNAAKIASSIPFASRAFWSKVFLATNSLTSCLKHSRRNALVFSAFRPSMLVI